MLVEPPPSPRYAPARADLPAPPLPEAPPDGYWRRLLPVLAVLAAVTRLPSFRHPVWNPDEGYLAVQARILADGGALYDTVVDRKPPLLPWLYEACFAVFGDESLRPLKVLAVVSQLVTAALLAAAARERWGDRAGRTAGVLYLLVSIGLNPEDAQAATFEIFILPFTAAAVRYAGRRRWTAAGLAVAGAVLVKQTGGAVLVPVLWLLWHSRPRRGQVLRLCAALVLPVAAAALLTDPAGLLFWTVTGSGAYAAFTGSELHVLSRGLANSALLAAACAGLVPPVVRVLRIARTGVTDLWLWLAASAAAVLAGFHFFGHYYLQLLPPLALLATAALQVLPRGRLTSALLASAAACALFLVWGLLAPRPELAHAQRLATEVRHRTGPQERVLLWGMHPETYWLADRAPATRYLTAGLLTNYSGGRDGPRVGEEYAVEGSWRTLTGELRGRLPALIVDDSRGRPYAPEHLPTLRRLLARHYEPLPGDVGGAVLYVRSAGR
ncbi:ArnT family glycosyltransferase [Streptomyces sp. WMMC940]|uniref:ArnT family glycosyltransferase n=1 Tax=Streptomyces sp. WMMC940 TaxID=3015153 RepID=UPI0022B69171|nr:glycosyltransferase family 39 protein [Streptomyces sp. WMMC940]MCZ7457391.1 glycosyltransferase family 39 protein [Streptomyces sp. WMMC940]